ncbi:hypothetical protein Pla123a_37260 [Posidoniimonas polymericola]|uniref:DUF3124 domain-containing protein n=1 Tax=Posidoniimonas polymericola TaxID=2528002 RepID=A0A5C5YHZ9_9BACT|nr:DUF3124 domain-containing protein [Posidoniimonas polymericola]TWT73832.1 hypothetical protein Pla123a_37260 [Posidoniimonas polymericola]
MPPLTEHDVEAFMGRFKLLLIVGGLLLGALILGGLLYMDARLETVRDALHFRNPENAARESITVEAPQSAINAVDGQTVYVPAYSHIYHQDGRSYLLTVTLSVRNTDPEHEIVVTSVHYYNTEGKLVKDHLDQPRRLAPLATAEFLVERDDTSGGSGANFLVEWVAEQPVTEPIVETVMIDTLGQQGISFARVGKPIKKVTPAEGE